MLGRACAGVGLLAFVVLVYRLHSLASRLEHDLELRNIARDMLSEAELGSQTAGLVGADPSTPIPQHAVASRHSTDDAQLVEAESVSDDAQQTHSGVGRWAELEELHRDWDLYVVNLDKRPDRLACTMQEFSRLGMQVNRLRGIDGTKLNLELLSFVTPEAPTADSVSTTAQNACHGVAVRPV